MSFFMKQSCRKCRCWDCWREDGFDPEACHACTHSRCPQARAAQRCVDRLLAAIRSGAIAVKGGVAAPR